ncbi:Fc.00g106810.m01.CDS01 [Cosmosporella sp. VM-42]
MDHKAYESGVKTHWLVLTPSPQPQQPIVEETMPEENNSSGCNRWLRLTADPPVYQQRYLPQQLRLTINPVHQQKYRQHFFSGRLRAEIRYRVFQLQVFGTWTPETALEMNGHSLLYKLLAKFDLPTIISLLSKVESPSPSSFLKYGFLNMNRPRERARFTYKFRNTTGLAALFWGRRRFSTSSAGQRHGNTSKMHLPANYSGGQGPLPYSNPLVVVAHQKEMSRTPKLPLDTLSGPDGSIAMFQAGISICIILLYPLHKLIIRVIPPWLKPFAQEEPPPGWKGRKWTHWTLFLALVSLAGLSLSVFGAVSGPLDLLDTKAPRHLVFLLDIVPWLIAALITGIGRPTKTPKLLLLLYLVMLFFHLTVYSIHFLEPKIIKSLNTIRAADAGLTSLAIIIIGNMPFRDPSWGTEDIGSAAAKPTHFLRSPEDNITLFQFLTVSWVTPLAKIAKMRELNVEDVWQLPFEFQHTRLYMAFRELKGKLIPCLIEANGLDLFISTSLAIVEKVSEVSNIRLTSKLYQSLDHNEPSDAVFWSMVMLCVDCIRQFSKTSSGWYSRKAYERSRGETFIGLFSKLLTRAVPGSETTEKDPGESFDDLREYPPSSKIKRFFGWFLGRNKRRNQEKDTQTHSASNAKVVNLVRGDTYEISQRFWEVPKVVSQPIKVIFTVYYLIDIMGWTACIGFALMAIFLGLNSILVRKSIALERQRAGHSDRRAQAVSHFVEASRPLKLNGWTSSWSNRIMKFRELEMAKRLQIARVNAGISTVNVAGGAAYPLASICLYTLILGDGLPNDVIWPSLQLFGHLEGSVKEAFDLISAFWKATIPVDRVNKYMAERDRDEDGVNSTANTRNIGFIQASFSRPSMEKLALRNLTFSFKQGLTIIRGKVGSGKSSLLLAALNEMEHRSGQFSRPDEPVAYCQQLPWLESKSIQENIVFHQAWNAQRYRDVLNACALTQDLKQLPFGDQTKLEEGGIGLSGGQKARVALARAIYSPCRILLLDDPLAALDHDTASTIVKRFLEGPLAKDRTIILVTHRDDLVLRLADCVIDVADGEARQRSREEIRNELQHPSHASVQAIAPKSVATYQGEDDEYIGAKSAPELDVDAAGVPLSIYTKYMKAGGWHHWVFLAIAYAISRYCDIARARLLEAWGKSSTASGSESGYWGLPDPGQHPKEWLYVLTGLSIIQILSYAAAQLLLAGISINAAKKLFKIAIDRVSKAPFAYYDKTPTGQLKNRLISDMGMVDGGILSPLESFVYNLITLTLSLIAIMSHQPSLLFIIVLVSLLFMYFFRIYVPISRSLRRMEMKFLTPIIANIGVMQDGLVTIRAMRVEHHFQDKHLDAVDDFQKQDHFFWSMAFWLDFRLGMSSAMMRFVLIVFMVWYGTPASAVGFVLTQTTVAMSAVQQLCEKFATLQLDAVSLERVDQLNAITPEETGDEIPPEDWPRPGDAVSFQNVHFHYAPGLPTVLDRVSFEIPGGSTCAILGRTGSGKSTIANALLMTVKPYIGTVRIGDVDLKLVDRETLRKRITYIQQDPTLFPGTLRDNIDPEGTFSDEDCTKAIGKVFNDQWTIHSQIDAGGKNLSQGQRQLVGIVRAVLRRSGLIILDEATASIDRHTATMVQVILRKALAQSTVLTIAHRLEAVEDADWCLRLDSGRVIESGPRIPRKKSAEGILLDA